MLFLICIGISPAVGDIDEGLVAYWSFDEGTGDIAFDSSGNGNDGTIYGATWCHGISYMALEFDGENTYVEVSDDPTLDCERTVTITVWVNITDLHSSLWHTVCAKDVLPFSDRNYGLFIHESGYIHLSYIDASGENIWINTPTNVIQQGTSYFIAGCIDTESGLMEIIVDIVPISSKNISTNMFTNDSSVLIGKHIGGDGTQFYTNGIIDEVRIYNRVLEEDEIQELYEFKTDYWAFLIGIEDYKYVSDCKYRDNDAIDMAELLPDYANWEEDNIIILLNSGATKLAIEDGIDAVSSQIDENDVFLFLFAGHGTVDDLWNPYLCPHDYIREDYETAISSEELFGTMEGVPCPKVLILESCYTGAFEKDAGHSFCDRLITEDTGCFLQNAPDFPFADNIPEDIIIMSAVKGYQLGYTMPPPWGGNSIFTWTIMRSWKKEKDANEDGVISDEETFQYASKATEKITGYFFLEQQPQMKKNYQGEIPLIILE